jgi:uncharacterized Zn finger protein
VTCATWEQIQALQKRRKARPTKESSAELDRLRQRLLAALDDDEHGADENGADENGADENGAHEESRSEDGSAHRSAEQVSYFYDPEDDEPEEFDPDGWGIPRNWTRFSPTRPIKVEAGLATRNRRGAIGETWWSKRFVAAVESTLAGGRLTRGRTYARQGQVIDLEIGPGQVDAQVQGSRKAPYRVRIAMPVASGAQWARIVDVLGAQAGYAARLLAGELPHEIEEVFVEAGVVLFPSPASRLATDCTCPDWANPCKHVAAVCYLVAEAFDSDPFLLLTFRGRAREGLLVELRARRGGGEGERELPAREPVRAVPALADCMLGFWKAGPELAQVQCRPRASAVSGAVLRQLPRGVVEVRGRDVADVFEPAYATLAGAAEARAFDVTPRP